MFLKSLTLKGFKSFAESTTLALEPGVTVVVGPNGSGKSNVVDAIAWVLGAQAPKSVRSQKMDDVIFAGTAKRAALGRAEVSLTVDNSAGLLGVEFSEVTVSRILFRSGDSEYSINGVPCRLLDVQELLSDAGVGRQQHVIVSQGQIDAVLNARPEERRAIIEEAAGILKFRKRKEKAERRLEATEANLLRVQDLLREVRRQLRPLERQAEAAQRHGELVAELETLRLFVSGREIAGLRAKLEAIEADRVAAQRADSEVKARLAELDTEIMSIEAQLSARGQSDLGDRLMRVEQLRERVRGLVAVLVERRRSLERDRGQLLDAGVVASLEADLTRFRDEHATVVDELAALAPEAETLDADEVSFRDERARLDEALAGDAGGSRAASAAAEVRGELRSVRSTVERSENELRRMTERRDELREQLEHTDGETARLRAECAVAEEVESPLVVEVEEAEARRAAAEAALEVASAERQRAAETASRWSARVEALQLALDAAHARAGAERLADVDGVLGTLLDLVEIDAGWEPAVEAALGEALTAVVVDGPDAGRRALTALRESDTSGAVLALGARTSSRHAPRVGEPVRSHVRSGRPGVSPLLDALVGHAVRVSDTVAAVEVALEQPDVIVVTDTGDRFSSSGWRVGAAAGGTPAAALDEAPPAA
ncbi:MAG: AAA family ATPase, partial [Ilumatobacteraceae bacterium]